jgi:L-lysine exporter family protein LysE/ArgO
MLLLADINSLAAAYATAATLVFALIVPIGAQNAYVLQRAAAGSRTTVVAVVVATVCSNTLLTVIGGFGIAHLLKDSPIARSCLFVAGTLFVLRLAWVSLRKVHRADAGGLTTGEGADDSPVQGVIGALGVSLLNPHAIIDTVVIMGGAISALEGANQIAFFMGVVSAESLWFCLIVIATGLLVRWLGSRAQRRIDQFSGIVLLVVGAWLAWSAFHTISTI